MEKAKKVEIGEVTHYFTNIGVAVVKLSKKLKTGDPIKFEGATTDFEQTAGSMQIDKNSVEEAGTGQEIGLKVNERVREGDKVYKIS
jgi:putative protease